MTNVHLEDVLLRELGVDAIRINLEEGTNRGGRYLRPLLQERINRIKGRPEFRITFDDPFDPGYRFGCWGQRLSLSRQAAVRVTRYRSFVYEQKS